VIDVRRSRVARDETGSTLLLTIGYCMLGLAIILVVASATTLYLERKRLFTVADYLASAMTDLDDAVLVGASSADGRSATVTLRSAWHAPISTDLVPVEVPIEVTVTARSVFH
jgi:hypothetical protein